MKNKTRNRMIIISLLTLTSVKLLSCSYTAPWRKTDLGRSMSNSSGKAVVVVTYAKRNKDQRGPFFRNVQNVLADLPNQDGLLGHSFRFQLLGNETWTISAWRDEAAVRKFSRSATHAVAVKDSATLTADVKIFTTIRKAWLLPLPWNEAVSEVSKVSSY
jgi:heme-degrading monooxygenase HmoA